MLRNSLAEQPARLSLRCSSRIISLHPHATCEGAGTGVHSDHSAVRLGDRPHQLLPDADMELVGRDAEQTFSGLWSPKRAYQAVCQNFCM